MAQTSPRRWIGLLGGTFDPIHYGHLKPALEAHKQLGLDEIWLMPNAIPPHKDGEITDSVHRLAMARAVCDVHSGFSLCDIELELAASGTPSYSVNTLKILKQRYPDCDFVFLMGMDSLLSLHLWHEWQQLTGLCSLLVAIRPGWQLEISQLPGQVQAQIVSQLSRGSTGQIQMLDVPPQDISSTEIRTQLQQGNLPAAMMPKEVADYIQAHNLYLSRPD
ncbi:nicotinate-nucleotide adenylyltransferase [Shewanella corallii]|uniref:Probable nicotinate-nucleotide adenylyltransferase n=1 Tax=Shewanella corallii TaxID=560080 RepID=A0ABT0N3D3_9GAMM|nr:nicotinate-nucleotide adenylyltransferase [Shewanella corallii]MCL2912610.1 nicotinate-nucleotide adenylyltransferase [Shewanella corallii]